MSSLRVIHLNEKGSASASAFAAPIATATAAASRNELCMPGMNSYSIEDFLQQQITTSNHLLEETIAAITMKKAQLAKNLDENNDDRLRSLQEELATLEQRRQHIRNQIESYTTQFEDSVLLRGRLGTAPARGGAGVGASAAAAASVAPPSVLPLWSSSSSVPFSSTGSSLLEDMELATETAGTAAPLSVAAGDLQEVTDVGDGGGITPWSYPEDDEPDAEAFPLSDYSQKVERKLRNLLQELQADRLREPDAMTWLYHLSGMIENVKMDLAS